jgi:hypothetical protein
VTVLEVTPDTVHPRHRPTVVSVHVDATDDLAGVASVELTAFKDVSDADTTAGVLRTASLAPDEAAPGTWTGMLRLPPGLGNGAWRLSLEALDTAGNARWLSAQELADLGLPASLGYTSPRDLTRPTLVSPRISPARIDVRERAGTVAVRVEARDDDSGIEKVVADPEFLPGGPDDVVLRRVSGTARHGVWQGSFEVPECLVPGGAQQVTVRARDRAGNVRRAHPRLVVQARTTLPPDARLGRTSEIPTAGPVVLRFPRPVTGISTDEVLVADAYGPLDPSAVAVPGSWRCWREEVHARRATSCLDGRVRRAEFTPGDGFAPGTGYLVDLAPTHHLGVIDLHGNPLEEWRTFRTASA